jgi:adenylate cyclase
MVIAGTAAFAASITSPWLRDLEYRTIDWRFAQRGEIPAERRVAIVAIDNNTDAFLGTTFPYPRSVYANAIERLTRAGAAAIVLDIQMLEPDPAGMQHDAALVRAAAASGRVIFATAPQRTSTAVRGSAPTHATIPLPLRGVTLPGGEDPLAASGAVVASSHQLQSRDGVMRWIPPHSGMLRTSDSGRRQDVPALSVAAVAVAAGESGVEPQYRSLPSPLMVNYAGPSALDDGRRGFDYVNLADLLKRDGAHGDLGWARNRIVLIGATSSVLQDLHETPFSKRMPGVEIHAHAIQTITDRSWLSVQDLRSAALWAVVLGAITWLLLGLTWLPVGLVLVVALNWGWVVWAERVFSTRNEVVQLVPTVAASGTAALAMFVILAVSAWRDRRRVASLFARYVPRDVVRELLDVNGAITVGGERREVTILFADIRNFTTLAERADPELLVTQLNEYFEQMIEPICEQQGTLDKFMGDGLMAIFGAPIARADHAHRAVSAAEGMLQRLALLNARRAERGEDPLEIGIGINTGEAIVGNMGSPSRRVEYTAIGDTVNLAARLESATRDLGVTVLVSDETARQADHHSFEACGAITVKGRSVPTGVLSLCHNPVAAIRGVEAA